VAVCDKCKRKPVLFVRYSGAHLCANHFCEFVEKRVRYEIRQQVDLNAGARIAVAVSGGKDSTVALSLVHKTLGSRKDTELCAITIYEGIAGYRSSSIPIVKKYCRQLGIEHIVVSFDDIFGTTMDRIAKAGRELATCSYCGVLRRAALNRTARKWGASYLATGLNLDDTAQSILMSFSRGDIERLARLGPHKRIQKGLVPRIQPLRSIPESETTLYAIVRKLRYHDLECPYAPEAMRNAFRSVVFSLEQQYPGTRHSILKSYDELRPALRAIYPPTQLRTCACGEPTVSRKCKACELIDSVLSSS